MTNDKYIKNLQNLQAKLTKSGLFEFTKALPKSAELYLVGGAVRDCLLGLPDSGDYDFVVRNVDAKKLEKILAQSGSVDFVGKRFGVFKFSQNQKVDCQLSIVNRQSIDIALPRTEHSLGTGAYRDFKIKSNPKLKIEDDLSRRDFTINAMAWKIKNDTITQQHNNEIIDPFDGLKDIQNKTIRTVGSPNDRFKEDCSRMLRAIRFACQLDFEIEKNTWLAIKKMIPQINNLNQKSERIAPHEVIAAELLKTLSYNPAKALGLLDESGAIKALIPELLSMKGCPQPKNWHSEGDVWKHTLLGLELLQSNEFKLEFNDQTDGYGFKTDSRGSQIGSLIDPELALGVLFHDIAKPVVIKTPEKDGTPKIQYHKHEKIGAEMTKKICERLRFQATPDFKIDCCRIVQLVGKHLLCVNAKIDTMKNTTIEKYFVRDQRLSQNLLKTFWIDAKASIPEVGEPNLSQYRKLLKRIAAIKKIKKKTGTAHGQIKTILSGNDIIKTFKIPSSPKIGEILELIREEQLAGRIKSKNEAIKFLRRTTHVTRNI